MKKTSLTPISMIAIIVLAGGAMFLLNNQIQRSTTTVEKSQATMAVPKLTETYHDNFRTDSLNNDKWVQNTIGNASVAQTTTNNLRMNIPDGHQNGRPKTATVRLKELIKPKGDFRAMAVLYRPVVTGIGSGVEGIRFTSTGSTNDEGATIRWVVDGASSKVSFLVTGPTGVAMERTSVDLPGNVAIFRLERINKSYRASYKVGNDLTSDTNWVILGEEENKSLGKDGYVSLFAHNGGAKDHYPKVTARFDSARIQWEGAPAAPDTKDNFSDAFSKGNIGPKWKASATSGTAIIETVSDNLNMNVGAGSVNNKPRFGFVSRLEPVIKEDKNFLVHANVFKPVVKGAGYGASTVSFKSLGTVDDESAIIKWTVSEQEKVNKLVFLVRAPDNSLLERASVDITSVKANKLTLRLSRTGNKYAASYRVGDSDQVWNNIGTEESGVLGGDGHIVLSTSNTGMNGKYPQVIGKFDTVSGWSEK